MHARPFPRPPFVLRRAVPCLLVLAWATWPLSAADSPDELKVQTDRWIALERGAADERNEWRTQKEALEASVQVLRTEQTNLNGLLEANDLAAGSFKQRLDRAQAELAAQEAAHAALASGAAALEQRLFALSPRLPQPLQERIGPHLAKLRDTDTEDGPGISERTQALVSALTAIDQFNNTLTLTHVLRPNGAGETVDVKVLYWGLAGAYAIDAAGTNAWILSPGPAGWEWREAPAEAEGIRTLIAVHEKQKNPAFVVLPVGLAGGAQ